MITDRDRAGFSQTAEVADLNDAYTCQEEVNKAFVRRLYAEILNQGDLSALDQLVADDLVLHTSIAQMAPGRAGFRQVLGMYLAAFPVQHIDLDDLIAAGSTVVARHTRYVAHSGEFMGVPPHGREAIVTGVAIFRIADRRIAELWLLDDLLSLLQQIGAFPVRL
jgi:steroid delta-isomerase-like uncharacterized protein